MCERAVAAAELLAAEGLDVTVVNCRFIKPLDMVMLGDLVDSHRLLVTVEDGTVVNGFGAYVCSVVEGLASEVRVVAVGVPDGTYEHASRGQQLAEVGLTGEGIANTVRAWAAEESLSTA